MWLATILLHGAHVGGRVGAGAAHASSRVAPSAARVPTLRSAPVAMASIGAAALPSELSELAASADFVFATDSRPVILFDGVCALCNGGVDFMLNWDRPDELLGAFRFAALQSDVGRALLARAGRQPDDLSSIVLVLANGEARTKSDAILEIGRMCGRGTPLEPVFPLASLFGLTVPKPVRDVFYDTVAANRYTIFGETESCRFSDDRFSARFIESIAAPAA